MGSTKGFAMKRSTFPRQSVNAVSYRLPSTTVHSCMPAIKMADRRLDIDINLPKEPEDRGVIYVPMDAETVVYTDPDGQTYEVDINDLIDADTDNEITVVDSPFDEDDMCDTKSGFGGSRKMKRARGFSHMGVNVMTCKNFAMQTSRLHLR